MAESWSHPNERYWLLKTICLNNLYGLDIMGEATEIARLRLFLKLIAQLDNVSQVEPLPDLDFNIKSGNLLVGIADMDDAQRRFEGSMLAIEGLKSAEQAAGQAAAAYRQFASAQLSQTGAGRVVDKHRLSARIGEATSQADDALHKMRTETMPFELWKDSHQPFHWFAEFPSVWQQGGFDVIVGNPPYIDKRQVTEYEWIGYTTNGCPNLYTLCVERAVALLNATGRIAIIVMHNLCFSRDFDALRSNLSHNLNTLWVSSYDRWSDSLFSGSAKVRNSIVVGSTTGPKYLYTTCLYRWLASQRSYLFSSLNYLQNASELTTVYSSTLWPFINDSVLQQIFSKLVSTHTTLGHHIITHPVAAILGYRDTADDQIQCWTRPPNSVNPEGNPAQPRSNKSIVFSSKLRRDLAYLVFAGRWGYLWWLTFGDGFHVTKQTFSSFPDSVSSVGLSAGGKDRIHRFADDLTVESRRHVTRSRRGQIGRQWLIGGFDLSKCRHITDEADWLLAQAWGLTREEYEAAGNLRDRMTFGNKG